MKKKERIVSYTAKELKAKRAKGESRTDWAKIRAMSQTQADRLAEEEDGPLPKGWETTVLLGLLAGKKRSK